MYCAAQAVDLRERVGELGTGTRAAYEVVRASLPQHRDGEPPAPDLTPLVNELR
jgi:histidine ammonia-lyase